MNTFKKALLAMSFVGMFGAAAAAHADTITTTYDPVDKTLSSSRGQTDTITFTQSIVNIANGFVVGFDTLSAATLSIFLKDDAAGDNESYKFTLGSTSTQTATGNNIPDVPGYIDHNGSIFWWNWTVVPAAAGSVTDVVDFNNKALSDLQTDGAISITIQAVSGDFIFDKAVLSADVTRGKLPPAAVPEPGTVAMLGLGLLGVAAARRKSSKNKNA